MVENRVEQRGIEKMGIDIAQEYIFHLWANINLSNIDFTYRANRKRGGLQCWKWTWRTIPSTKTDDRTTPIDYNKEFCKGMS